MNKTHLKTTILSAIFFLAVLFTTEIQAQGLTAEDIASIKSVGAVVMNSEGSHIAYTLSVPRTEDDTIGRNFSELYIIPAGGGNATPVKIRPNSASSPQWGPGGRLYFLSNISEHHSHTQVYSVDNRGREIRKHTDAAHGISSFKWSPDGTSLAYLAMDPVSEERRKMIEKGFDMIVAGENLRYMRLWVQNEGEEARIITPENLYVWDFAWAPDNRRLSVRVSDKPGADQDMLYTRYAIIGKDGSDMLEVMTSNKKKDAMSWSPDGSKLAVLAGKVYSDPLPQNIWIISTDGSGKENITPPRWEVTPESIAWMDNRTVLFTGVDRSSTYLYSMRIDRGEPTQIAGGGKEIFRNFSADGRYRMFAAAVNTSSHPSEVYIADFRRGNFERLTFHNSWLAERALGRQSSITWSGADDIEIEGILIKPVDFVEGQRYPLAVLPHGGPEGISMNGWNTRPLYPVQLLANEGYMVFKPNYRGSGGRGTWFASANHRDLGGKEFDDVLLGIDYLYDSGLIDADKVGISGTSYGGYFAAWAATRYSDRFAAGITFAGLSNWISFMGTTDIPHEMSVVHWDLYWFDNPGQNWERSPVAWLKHANTPLLVATGLADERVHPEQSIQLHQFLEMLDIPTGLVLYPRQPHGLTERAHQLDFMYRVVDWFDEHVK